jgi:hypothetical protein
MHKKRMYLFASTPRRETYTASAERKKQRLPSGRRHIRAVSLVLAAVSGLLMLNAGPAWAVNGGTVTGGYEIPSEHVTLSSGQAQCATFHKINCNGTNDPTIHTLPMSGNFGLTSKNGSGTATFTINNDWYAGPAGTYTSNTCTTPGSVAGTLSISFPGWSCSPDTNAQYTRSSTTTYRLVGTVHCDNTSTQTVETTSITVTFTGSQILCGGTGQPTCNNVNAGTNISGSYSWTSP